MDRVKLVREETEEDGEAIEINNKIYNIKSLNLVNANLLEDLDIMPIIGRNIEHFFNNLALLKELNKLAEEQKSFIKDLVDVNKEKPIYRETDRTFYKNKIVQNNLKVECLIKKLFEGIKDCSLQDFFSEFDSLRIISPNYQKTIFEDNKWFEVIVRECTRYVTEELFHLRKEHYRLYVNKNLYGNEDTPFETDVVLIFNNTLTLFEAKSGNKRQITRADFLYFESKKKKVNADRGIFILYEKWGDTTLKPKKYERENIFLFDNIRIKKFKDFIKLLETNLNDLR